jgi:hypothetical protein
MFDKKIEMKDLPDEFVEQLNQLGDELTMKICKLLDEISDKSVAFHCFCKAYKVIVAVHAVKFNIPDDVIKDILHAHETFIFGTIENMRTRLKNDRPDS